MIQHVRALEDQHEAIAFVKSHVFGDGRVQVPRLQIAQDARPIRAGVCGERIAKHIVNSLRVGEQVDPRSSSGAVAAAACARGNNAIVSGAATGVG